MSSDLRHHPVSYFALPLIERIDRQRFELHCYSFSTAPVDAAQLHVADKATAFHLDPGISSRQATQNIARDKMDILFKLGGTTHTNKLRAMTWRLARLQASWLGYPHFAGLGTIDYILVDPHLRPPDPALLIEKPFEMRHSWVALGKLGFHDRVSIDPVTPEERTGIITFGTMNNPCKYNPQTFAIWAEILRKVPGSRFLFVRPEGATEPFREGVQRVFAAHGVDLGRIGFVPVRGTYMQHYNEIAIALDPFPHTGGTTTCKALWMGVPTVTMVGEAFFD